MSLKRFSLIAFGLGVIVLVVYVSKGCGDDFRVFYRAGKFILNGNAAGLYDVSAYPISSAGRTPFIRAAWESLVFVPFAALPYKFSLWLWSAVNLAAFGFSAWLVRDDLKRFLEPQKLSRSLALGGALLAIGCTLGAGQDDGLFLMLVVLALTAAKERRDLDAGLWLALATIKLQLLLPLFALIIIRKRWKIAEGAALGGFGLILTSILVAGPTWFGDCVHAQGFAAYQTGHFTARYLLIAYGSSPLIWLALALGMIVSFLAVRKKETETAAAWLIVATVFFNWHSLTCDYVTLLPAAVKVETRSS